MTPGQNRPPEVDVDLSLSDLKKPLQPAQISLKAVFRDSGKLFRKTVLISFLLVVAISLVTALFRFVYVGVDWHIFQINPQYIAIVEKSASPDVTLTPEEVSFRNSYQLLTLFTQIGRWTIPFFSLTVILFLTAGKMWGISTEEEGSPETWAKSFSAPFQSFSQGLTTGGFFLLFPIVLTVGTVLMIIPGVAIFIAWVYTAYAVVIDGHSGRQALIGGRFYARNHFMKLVIFFFVAIFIPFVIGSLVTSQVLSAVGYTDAYYFSLIDPTNRRWGAILLYFFVNHLFENIWFLYVPALFGAAFFRIREQKMGLYSGPSKTNVPPLGMSPHVLEVEVDPGVDFFHCPQCKTRLPISARKCSSCGSLIRLKSQRKPSP